EIPTIATEAAASRDEVAAKPANIFQRRWRINATGQSRTRWNFSTMSPIAPPAAKGRSRTASEYDQINRARYRTQSCAWARPSVAGMNMEASSSANGPNVRYPQAQQISNSTIHSAV